VKEVAYFGLAADPVHNGHMVIAELVGCYVDEVWLVPCYQHRFNKNMVDYNHRLAMCKLAARGKKRIKVKDFEIRARWTGGTYDFLKQLSAKHPDIRFWVVMGQDNAENIEAWKDYQKLISEFSCIVYGRGDSSGEMISSAGKWYSHSPHKFAPMNIGVSSTDVKKAIAKNPRITEPFLAPYVYEYIKMEGLYGYKESNCKPVSWGPNNALV